MAVFESIVQDNQLEHSIWTLWNGNANATITPSIHFQEVCTLNIAIEHQSYYDMFDVGIYLRQKLEEYR
jgi:hypothetical protein